MAQIDIETTRMRWQTRRQMTWITFIAYLLLTVFVMISPVPSIEVLMVPYGAFSTFVGTVVLGYFGLATFDDCKSMQGKDAA